MASKKGGHFCHQLQFPVPPTVFFSRYVDYDLWPEPLWPQCCFGPAYVLSPEAIGSLLDAHESGNNPFLPFEDIYVTGVLARAARIDLINYDDRIFTNYLGKERLIVHKGLSHWKPEYIAERWNDTAISALGLNNFETFLKKQFKKSPAILQKKMWIEQSVEKRRQEFFQQKKKRQIDLGKTSAPREDEKKLAKQRQIALKKPVEPYLL